MTTQPTAYENLKAHLSHHAYKRGAYKGAAPADASRRGRNRHRVEDRGSYIVIVFHATHIIRAYPDGRLVLDTNGWSEHPTTKAAVSDSLRICGHQYRGYLHAVRHGGYSQTAFRNLRFYDGMELDVTGRVTTPLKPFSKRVADREARAEFRADTADFRAMLPVLHATTTPRRTWPDPRRDFDNPKKWADIVAHYWRPTHQETWRAIYADATSSMTMFVDVPLEAA